MYKICKFYQDTLDPKEWIESLVEEDKYIKEKFTSILERETQLHLENISKFYKLNKIIMYVSFNQW